MEVSRPQQPSYPYTHGNWNSTTAGHAHQPVAQLINYCLEFGEDSLSLCKRVTCRITPPRNRNVDDWFILWFSPFTTAVNAILRPKGLDVTVEPFRTLVVESVRLFVHAIGEKDSAPNPPPTALARFGCGCGYCVQMREFLKGPNERKVFREVQVHRTHLEKQLAIMNVRSWGLTWHTEAFGTPHQLIVSLVFCFQIMGCQDSNSMTSSRSLGTWLLLLAGPTMRLI